MTRDLDRLGSEQFDLLVIGGGIHGLAAAYDAAGRGLRVALVERDDFGSGASFNHQRTVHGGLRALQRASLRRVREGIRERRTFARIAPHYVTPFPFITGIYGGLTRGRLAMKAALRVYDAIGRSRNAGVSQELHLPASRLESRTATKRLFPLVRQEGLKGGAVWYDYQMQQADRLTLAFALGAQAKGATLANHMDVVALERDAAGRVTGARAVDRIGGRNITIQAEAVLSATGSQAAAVAALAGLRLDVPLVRAMNVMTSRPASDIGLAAPSSTGRMLTIVGWRGRALAGTGQSERLVPFDAQPPDREEILAFIAQVNEAFPSFKLQPSEVTLVHHAVVPAEEGSGRPELKAEPELIAHAKDGAPGFYTLVGVKYTTARKAAEGAVTRIGAGLARTPGRSRSGVDVLPSAEIADVEAIAVEAARAAGVELPTALIRHLSAWYGSATAPVIALMADRPEWREPLGPGTQVTGAEIAHAAQHEQALRLRDAVLRRTLLGSAGHPGAGAVDKAAAIMAAIHGWDAARVAEEKRLLEEIYKPLPL
ncbi:MAG TPA: FAD-dependent oxidoreductase [Vicinamibacterales bacterium]|nr:FAD-dependent oxidoreductase [Vicinamibacterales bacterium]